MKTDPLVFLVLVLLGACSYLGYHLDQTNKALDEARSSLICE